MELDNGVHGISISWWVTAFLQVFFPFIGIGLFPQNNYPVKAMDLIVDTFMGRCG
jgi:hypothetical protein